MTERHIIRVEYIKRVDGETDKGFRQHIITLGNQDAADRVISAIQAGDPWDELVTKGDCLEWMEGE